MAIFGARRNRTVGRSLGQHRLEKTKKRKKLQKRQKKRRRRRRKRGEIIRGEGGGDEEGEGAGAEWREKKREEEEVEEEEDVGTRHKRTPNSEELLKPNGYRSSSTILRPTVIIT